MNIEECEKVYGKLIKEDETHCYFEGKGEFGVCVPKHTYWELRPERSKREDLKKCVICELKYPKSNVPNGVCDNCSEDSTYADNL